MAYITEQDLIDELGENVLVQLTDNDGLGEINPARIGKAIQYGEGLFDSFARARYAVPVPVTQMVKSVCLDLAVFHLYKSRASVDEGVYKIRFQTHEQAVKLLRAINRGEAGLDIPTLDETVVYPATADQILTNATNAKYTDDTLRGF